MTKNNNFYYSHLTPVRYPISKDKIEPNDRIVFTGSCFATNLYQWMKSHFLPVAELSFGALYNPISICQSLERILLGQDIKEEELFLVDNKYRHFDLSNFSFSSSNKIETLTRMNEKIQRDKRQLLKTDYLVVTLGTAYAYKQKDTGRVVANCHKVQQDFFYREPISIEEGYNSLKNIFILLQRANPKLRIILSLSPVRYLREDARENSYSKALLRCIIEELRSLPFVEYFPASEILVDEMRDYRWYASDMLHPSVEAIDYMLRHFVEYKGSRGLSLYLQEIEPLMNIYQHKPITTEGKQQKKEQWKSEVYKLSVHYPHLRKMLSL